MRRDTLYLSVFSPNTGKYVLEKTPHLDTFHAMYTFPISAILEWERNMQIRVQIFSHHSLLESSLLTLNVACISESCAEIKIKGLHNTFWGTKKKRKIKV